MWRLLRELGSMYTQNIFFWNGTWVVLVGTLWGRTPEQTGSVPLESWVCFISTTAALTYFPSHKEGMHKGMHSLSDSSCPSCSFILFTFVHFLQCLVFHMSFVFPILLIFVDSSFQLIVFRNPKVRAGKTAGQGQRASRTRPKEVAWLNEISPTGLDYRIKLLINVHGMRP